MLVNSLILFTETIKVSASSLGNNIDINIGIQNYLVIALSGSANAFVPGSYQEWTPFVTTVNNINFDKLKEITVYYCGEFDDASLVYINNFRHTKQWRNYDGPILGYTSVSFSITNFDNIRNTDNTVTVRFGAKDIYGGIAGVTNGTLKVTLYFQ